MGIYEAITQTLASLGFPVEKGTFTLGSVVFTGTTPPTNLTIDAQWARHGEWIDLDIGIFGTSQGSGITRVDITSITGMPKPNLLNGQTPSPTQERPRSAGDVCATNSGGAQNSGGAGIYQIANTTDQYRIVFIHSTLSAIAYRSHFRYKSTQG